MLIVDKTNFYCRKFKDKGTSCISNGYQVKVSRRGSCGGRQGQALGRGGKKGSGTKGMMRLLRSCEYCMDFKVTVQPCTVDTSYSQYVNTPVS